MCRSSPCLLIADDDADDVLILQSELISRNTGIKVIHVSNGPELIDFLDHCPARQLPDLLMLDYKMPGPSGAEVLSQLCADQRYDRLVKVVWSTSRLEKDAATCRRLGAFEYFIKPATNRDLTELTGKVMDILEVAVAMED